MKKYETIKKHKEFDYIIHKCPYKKSNSFIIYNKESDFNYPRFGIAVSKKLGNAVTRNRAKRVVRELIHNNKKLFKNNKDYIIIIKKGLLDLSYKELTDELIKTLR